MSIAVCCTGAAKTNNSDPKLKRNAYFCTDRCQLLSTGARVLNFVDRRGDFEKWCVSLAPVVENASSPKSSKTNEFMTCFFSEKWDRLTRNRHFLFCRGLVSDSRTSPGPLAIKIVKHVQHMTILARHRRAPHTEHTLFLNGADSDLSRTARPGMRQQ